MAIQAGKKAMSEVLASEAFELYKQGWTRDAIAKKLGKGPSMVGYYIRDTLTRLAKENATDLVIIRAEIKERLLYVAAESVKAWEASKQFTTKKTKKSVKQGGKDGTVNEVSEDLEVGHGDVKFLELAKDTIDSLTNLYGAAPKAEGAGTISISQEGNTTTIKTSWGVATPPIKNAEAIDVTEEVKEIEYSPEEEPINEES
jgi:predicted transcriptional regulator